MNWQAFVAEVGNSRPELLAYAGAMTVVATISVALWLAAKRSLTTQKLEVQKEVQSARDDFAELKERLAPIGAIEAEIAEAESRLAAVRESISEPV